MLKGERVVLRPYRADDFDAWYHLNDNVDLTLLASDTWLPHTVEFARQRWDAQLQAGHDERIKFAIEADGEFIGYAALKHVNQQSQNAWLTIVLGESKVGQGYGRDALNTLLRYAFDVLNLHRISLETWAQNERALRCYQAVGFVQEGYMREAIWLNGRFEDVVQMGVLRREWRERMQQGNGQHA